MPSSPRSVRSETNLTRAPGLWATGPHQMALPIDTHGLGVAVTASGRLSLSPDLDVLAWVCERWATTRFPDGKGGEIPDPEGVARFTMFDLGSDLYGRKPGGKENRVIRGSLWRLLSVVVSITGYDAATGETGERLASLTHLLTTVGSERLDGAKADPRRLGALRGDSFRVEVAPWLRRQILAGNVTYLAWRVLRQLDGVAKRTWVYLEAERWKPVGDGLMAVSVGLGNPALESLGAGGFARHRDARRALDRAGKRIVAADDRYHSVAVERRPGGYALVAHRLDAERQKIRRAVRAGLED